MKIVGINVKNLRKEKDLSLRGLASKVGVSASLISQLETGKVAPSLETLKKIATALDSTVSALVGENIVQTNNPFLRKADRKSLNSLKEGVQMFLLTSKDYNKQMEPLLFKLEPNASSGKDMYKHFGQEFVLIIKGTLEVMLNNVNYILRKGDSLYFNSSTPHQFKNIDRGITEAVWVVTPPTF